jgi:ADP-heptose:LPS heptosyltransferase
MANIKLTYILPFKFNIPNDTEEFLQKNGWIKSWSKFIKRYLYIFFKNQNSLEVFQILPIHKKILWINLSALSFGDCLMDLSGRVLLRDFNIDLFTSKKNANLFLNDKIFSNVFSDHKMANVNKYDLVIVDSYSTRSIKIKAIVAPFSQYVGMYGYYNGPDINRVLFSFHQINNLLGYKHNIAQITELARCSMSISVKDKETINDLKLPKKFVTIAIGGDWPYRTYNKWDAVVEGLLDSYQGLNIVLVGSDNGKKLAKKIADSFSSVSVFNYVDFCSFTETCEIIKKSQILLCSDSGLMHAAIAVNTPIIPLFARINSDMRLTNSDDSFSIFDQESVNNIEVATVLERFEKAINFFDNHHQV